MQHSGQTMAQKQQPEHCALGENSAKLCPFLFIAPDLRINFFGQTLMHRKQPLQFSLFIIVLAI
jgi:hypothetical protein